VGFCDGQKWRWGRFSPRTSVSPANPHSICFSTIIFTITRGWHNRPGVAAVLIASQSRIKKKRRQERKVLIEFFYLIIIIIIIKFLIHLPAELDRHGPSTVSGRIEKSKKKKCSQKKERI
jgi:hypothetical protein